MQKEVKRNKKWGKEGKWPFLLPSRIEHSINWKFFTCSGILCHHEGNLFSRHFLPKLHIFYICYYIFSFDRFEDFSIVHHGRAFEYTRVLRELEIFFPFRSTEIFSYKFYVALENPAAWSENFRPSSRLWCALSWYSLFCFIFAAMNYSWCYKLPFFSSQKPFWVHFSISKNYFNVFNALGRQRKKLSSLKI